MTRKWGPWTYYEKRFALVFTDPKAYTYAIDLSTCTESSEILDWIIQLSNKTWVSHQDLGYLVQALKELLNPQANFCSFGKSKSVPEESLKGLVQQSLIRWGEDRQDRADAIEAINVELFQI